MTLETLLSALLFAGKYIAILSQAGFGVYGLMSDFKKDGRLTKAGRIAIFGIVASGFAGLLAQAGESYVKRQQEAREQVASRQALERATATQENARRALFPFKTPRVEARWTVKFKEKSDAFATVLARQEWREPSNLFLHRRRQVDSDLFSEKPDPWRAPEAWLTETWLNAEDAKLLTKESAIQFVRIYVGQASMFGSLSDDRPYSKWDTKPRIEMYIDGPTFDGTNHYSKNKDTLSISSPYKATLQRVDGIPSLLDLRGLSLFFVFTDHPDTTLESISLNFGRDRDDESMKMEFYFDQSKKSVSKKSRKAIFMAEISDQLMARAGLPSK
jgi:hypothetical protein